MTETIEFIIADFNCNEECIDDAFYKYLTEIFAVKYPKRTKALLKHYSSQSIDDLFEKIKDIIINEIFERNEYIEKYFE